MSADVDTNMKTALIIRRRSARESPPLSGEPRVTGLLTIQQRNGVDHTSTIYSVQSLHLQRCC